jgi:group II intron reverse transcriptase/maturase
VVDRWVQQAVLQVLQPIYEPTFHASSHGFRRGRGAQTALDEAKKYLAEGYSITVDIDLSKFFDRVHHQRLLNRLGQRVADGRILKLVHRMLQAKVVLPDGARISTEVGTPQGGPLSPLLSNVVLDELDWELARRGLRFVRYADDLSVFVGSERAGKRVMASIRKFIDRRLRLVVNEAHAARWTTRTFSVRMSSRCLRTCATFAGTTMPGTAARRTATGTRRTTGTTTSAFGLPELREWSGYFARRNRPLFPFRCRRRASDK